MTQMIKTDRITEIIKYFHVDGRTDGSTDMTK